MIYQFLYARKREGFRQLNDWTNVPFSENDRAGMESLRKYTVAGGMNISDLPECFYFYNVDLSTGRAGVVGRTSYVRAGSSRESGDRETSFVHKYIFTGKEYEAIHRDSDLIFGIRSFCERVEDAENFRDATADLDRIVSPGGAESSFEMSDILQKMGMDEKDFLNFLYALIGTTHKVSKRVYLMLPSPDRKGSDMALKFCRTVFAGLPAFIRANCGFITFTDTFHNTTTNNIPGGISLIFVLDNDQNALKLPSIAEECYVFDRARGYIPDYPVEKLDMFTREMLNNLKNGMLHGADTGRYDRFFSMFAGKVNMDYPFSPEMISAAYQFYSFYDTLKEKGLSIGFPENLAYLLSTFLRYPEIVSKEIHEDVVDYVKRILALKKGDSLLDFIAAFYGAYEPLRDLLAEKVCELCKEAYGSEDRRERMMGILTHPAFQSGDLLPQVYNILYGRPEYYSQASYLVMINLRDWLKSDGSPADKKIRKIFDSISDLYNHYPGLVLYGTYIDYVFEVFKEILFGKKADGSEDIYALYCATKDFVKSHGDCAEYMNKVLNLANDYLYDVTTEIFEGDNIARFFKWKDTIFKELSNPTVDTISKRLDEFVGREYLSVIRTGDYPSIYKYFDAIPDDMLCRVFPMIGSEVVDRVSRFDSDDEAENDFYRMFLIKLFTVFFNARYKTGLEAVFNHVYTKGRLPTLVKMYNILVAQMKAEGKPFAEQENLKEFYKQMLERWYISRNFYVRLDEHEAKSHPEVEEFLKNELGLMVVMNRSNGADGGRQKKGMLRKDGRPR